MEYSDKEIIQKILSGNLDAYELLVNRYADQILNLCYRYLNSREEAEDATQDVFLKAYRALKNWEPRAKFKTWLFRIAINHCLNIVRRQKKVPFQGLEEGEGERDVLNKMTGYSAGASGEEILMSEQQNNFIRNALWQLPENQRQVIILYYYQELSYEEISEVLDVSISSIESRLFRAKRSLAKILKK